MRYVSPRPNSPVFWSPELKNRTTRSQTYKMLGFGDILIDPTGQRMGD
jgi:hypothetical protein